MNNKCYIFYVAICSYTTLSTTYSYIYYCFTFWATIKKKKVYIFPMQFFPQQCDIFHLSFIQLCLRLRDVKKISTQHSS